MLPEIEEGRGGCPNRGKSAGAGKDAERAGFGEAVERGLAEEGEDNNEQASRVKEVDIKRKGEQHPAEAKGEVIQLKHQ